MGQVFSYGENGRGEEPAPAGEDASGVSIKVGGMSLKINVRSTRRLYVCRKRAGRICQSLNQIKDNYVLFEKDPNELFDMFYRLEVTVNSL